MELDLGKSLNNYVGRKPIENTLKKREIIMTFKAIQDESPGYMSQMFKFNHT